MMNALIIKEIKYVALGLFDDLMDPLIIYMYYIKFFDCAVCFNLAIAKKWPCLSPK